MAAAPARAHDTVEGELYGVHADYFHEGESSTHWRLQTADGTIGVLPTTLPALTQGNNEVAIEDQDPGRGGGRAGQRRRARRDPGAGRRTRSR